MRRHNIALPAVVSGTAAILAVASVATSLTIEALLLAFIGILLSYALITRLIQGKIDIFEPLIIFLIAWAVLFFARPTAMFVTGSFEVSTYQIRDGMAGMLLMALLGAAGFLAMYALPAGRSIGQRLSPLPEMRNLGTAGVSAVVVAMVGVALFGVFIALSGGLSTLQALMTGRQENAIVLSGASTTNYLQGALALTLPASLILLFVASKRRSLSVGLLGVIALLLGLIVTGPSGIRGWILPYLGAPFILFYLSRGRRPKPLVVLLILFTGFVFNGFIAQARESSNRQATGLGQILSENFTKLGDSWTRFVLGGDTEMPNLLALEVLKVPSLIPFQYGAATGEVFVQPVPRQIWTSKPRSGDEVLTQALFIDPGLNRASRQYTPMANFYLDFGYAGVFFGMGLLGLIGRTLLEYLRANPNNGSVQLFYAATLPFMITLLRGSIGDTAGRLIFIIPPLLFVIYLARRVRPEMRVAPWPSAVDRGSGTTLANQRVAQGDSV